jgi:hypothetical protein
MKRLRILALFILVGLSSAALAQGTSATMTKYPLEIGTSGSLTIEIPESCADWVLGASPNRQASVHGAKLELKALGNGATIPAGVENLEMVVSPSTVKLSPTNCARSVLLVSLNHLSTGTLVLKSPQGRISLQIGNGFLIDKNLLVEAKFNGFMDLYRHVIERNADSKLRQNVELTKTARGTWKATALGLKRHVKSWSKIPVTAADSGTLRLVTVGIKIDHSGRIFDLSPKSDPSSVWNAGFEAIRSWSFEPFQIDGKAVEVEGDLLFTITPSGVITGPSQLSGNATIKFDCGEKCRP